MWLYCSAAGPNIGLADRNNGPLTATGLLELRAETWFSIELSATHAVPEWGGQLVSFRQEEDAATTQALRPLLVVSRPVLRDPLWLLVIHWSFLRGRLWLQFVREPAMGGNGWVHRGGRQEAMHLVR